jgi:internalin A
VLDYGGVKVDAVTNVSTLRHLRRLRHLVIVPSIDVGDFSGFPDLPRLLSISISGNKVITSLESLRRFPELSHLDASDARRLEDVGGLRDLPKLTLLNLNLSMGVEDLTPIERLIELQRLHIMHGQQTTLDFLKPGLPVEHLDTDGAAVLSDISALAAVADTLRHLDLQNCPSVSDWSSIATLHRLDTLVVSGTSFGASAEVISSLVGLSNIQALNCELADLRPLEGLTSLTTLYLRGNGELYDIRPLAGLQLRLVDLSATAVEDLTPLFELKGAVIRLPIHIRLDELPADFRVRNRITRVR